MPSFQLDTNDRRKEAIDGHRPSLNARTEREQGKGYDARSSGYRAGLMKLARIQGCCGERHKEEKTGGDAPAPVDGRYSRMDPFFRELGIDDEHGRQEQDRDR